MDSPSRKRQKIETCNIDNGEDETQTESSVEGTSSGSFKTESKTSASTSCDSKEVVSESGSEACTVDTEEDETERKLDEAFSAWSHTAFTAVKGY